MKAALGFRAKTGRAIAVVLGAGGDRPVFVWRGETSLVDPSLPETAEPYHQVMELPWSEAIVAVEPLVSAIQAVADRAVLRLVDEMRSRTAKIHAIAVVGSPQKNLERIGNEHIRAHAAEGVLFRRVLEVAARNNRLECNGFSEDQLRDIAGSTLGTARIQETLSAVGRTAGPPWRADERLAATAAWLALA